MLRANIPTDLGNGAEPRSRLSVAHVGLDGAHQQGGGTTGAEHLGKGPDLLWVTSLANKSI